MIHRDLKLENLLIKMIHDVPTVKLGDFGAARIIESHGSTFIGTKPFMAPEVLAGDKYDYPVDVYALGLIIHIILEYKSRKHLEPLKGRFYIITNSLKYGTNDNSKTVIGM